MREDILLKTLDERQKGSLISMIIQKDMTSSLTKAARDKGYTLIKRSKVVVRWGVLSPANTKRYKEAYGDRTPGSLPWGEWEIPGILIKNESKSGTKKYFRCYDAGIPNKSVYILNGENIDRNELYNSDLLLNSAKNKKENPSGVYAYGLDNIISILPKKKDRAVKTV